MAKTLREDLKDAVGNYVFLIKNSKTNRQRVEIVASALLAIPIAGILEIALLIDKFQTGGQRHR